MIEYRTGDVVLVNHLHLDTAREIDRQETDDTGVQRVTYSIDVKRRPMFVIVADGYWLNLLYMTSKDKRNRRDMVQVSKDSYVDVSLPLRYPLSFVVRKCEKLDILTRGAVLRRLGARYLFQ